MKLSDLDKKQIIAAYARGRQLSRRVKDKRRDLNETRKTCGGESAGNQM